MEKLCITKAGLGISPSRPVDKLGIELLGYVNLGREMVPTEQERGCAVGDDVLLPVLADEHYVLALAVDVDEASE